MFEKLRQRFIARQDKKTAATYEEHELVTQELHDELARLQETQRLYAQMEDEQARLDAAAEDRLAGIKQQLADLPELMDTEHNQKMAVLQAEIEKVESEIDKVKSSSTNGA